MTIVCLGNNDRTACAQDSELPRLPQHWVANTRESGQILRKQKAQLAQIRGSLKPGQTPELPDPVTALSPTVAKIRESFQAYRQAAQAAGPDAPPETKRAILAGIKSMADSGPMLVAAYDELTAELDQWDQLEGWPADSFDNYRRYRMQLWLAFDDLILPAIRQFEDRNRESSKVKFAREWLALEQAHGSAAILDITLHGNTSSAALAELEAAVGKLVGEDKTIITAHLRRSDLILVSVAPCARVVEIDPIDVVGDQWNVPHLNNRSIERELGDGNSTNANNPAALGQAADAAGPFVPKGLPQPGATDYESQLVKLMLGGSVFDRDAAARALLAVPKEELSPAMRRKIAKAFLQYFEAPNHLNRNVAIRGLVKFGGKHATKYLVEAVRTSNVPVNSLIYQALAKYPTDEGAAAVASRLRSGRDRRLAAETLIKMGPIAEPAAIEALRTQNEDVALAAIYVLERIGTEEAMSVLAVARNAGNREIKSAATQARAAIRKRRD
ncbi:MAG: HEAT repeat domain-containing protein [Planctomycetota bacterium]